MSATRFVSTGTLAILFAAAACTNDSNTLDRSIADEDGPTDCTRTQGYWKNHPDAWPVDSLTLGNVTYTEDELLDIFHQPVQGNGLIALAHQLIAAKLNVASGADDTQIGDAIDDADDLIGDLVVPPIGDGYLAPSETSALTEELDEFNNSGEGSCAPTSVCGNELLEPGEECDDGNNTDGDGCSSTCTLEEPPVSVCGNEVVEAGEECDDGNTTGGDGCSSTCTLEEPPVPVCGNGILETGELCDDGNTTSGDGCSATCTPEIG